ncbi:nuclear transport factor 2 family protein [Nocardia vermiculata]|uniref:Nuclear transport factor 2 family protein n=1 Tax=Nocardia vermiculata TaxID=257274 RepID=A0A846Y8L6_9NOCA|nr:nuclear transport factor 2 family protein [Nocardia vermiculata]NKY53079.1 nuclear transport factor 2 family protein [Nocardia vermiculata]
MLTLQEISDRFEIEDLMVRYSHAVDTQQWELLDEVFTADARIDYSAMGGACGGLTEIKQFLASVMPNFLAFQHAISNSSITVDGETATGRTMCQNPMLVGAADGEQNLMLCGLWYLDTFRRVDGRWRIAERVEEKSYMFLAAAPGAQQQPG